MRPVPSALPHKQIMTLVGRYRAKLDAGLERANPPYGKRFCGLRPSMGKTQVRLNGGPEQLPTRCCKRLGLPLMAIPEHDLLKRCTKPKWSGPTSNTVGRTATTPQTQAPSGSPNGPPQMHLKPRCKRGSLGARL